MKKAVDVDLTDLSDILEGLVAKLKQAKFTQAEMIDIAARLKPVAKHCKAIDEEVKEIVKEKLKHKDGTLPGTMFKAILKLIPVKRFNQSKFKEDKPVLFTTYLEDNEDERVTFETR